MALPSQLVHVDFRGGLDTKTDEKLVVPGKLTTLENGIFTRGDAITKRNGYTDLGNSQLDNTLFTAGERLATYEDELLLLNAGKAFSYSEARDQWVPKGDIVPCTVKSERVIQNSAQQTLGDHATAGGVTLIAWTDSRDSGSVRASVIDAVTGVPFINDTQVSATGSRPKVVVINGFLIVVWSDSSGNMKARRVDPTVPDTLEAEPADPIANTLDATFPWFDVVSTGTSAVFAFNNASGSVTIGYLTDVPAAGGLVAGFPVPVSVGNAADSCITVVINTAASDDIYVAYHNTTDGVEVIARNADLTAKFAATQIDSTLTAMEAITAVFASSTSLRVFYQVTAATTPNRFVRTNTISDVPVAGTAAVFKRSVGLAHKAFVEDSVVYVGLVHDSTLQATYFLVNVSGSIIAKALPLVAGGLVADPTLPQVVESPAGVFQWAETVKTKFVSEVTEDSKNTTYTDTGVALGTYDFTDKDRYRSAQMGRGLVMGGGVPSFYDGAAFAELGFNLFPEGFTLAVGGSNLLTAGTYSVAVIYQWIDRRGQVHRSAPTFDTVVSAGSDEITVTIPTLRLSDKSNVTLEVYRTEANGSIHYRVTSATSPTDNDATTDTVAFVTGQADTAIISGETLYTTGGVVENISPPAASIVSAASNRLWLAGLEDESLVWFTKPSLGNNLGPEFSDLLTIRLNRASGQEIPGPVTAIAAIDDKIVFFKRDAILVVFGAGPNAAGIGTFSEPQIVATDVGCIDQRSVVFTTNGIWFKSAKGFRLLNRGLQLARDPEGRELGDEVVGFNDLTVTSGALIDDVDQVRFTHSDGVALVWDTFFAQWSSFTNHQAVDAVLHQNVYHYLKSDGTVFKETPGQFLDANKPYSLVLETAWLKFAGLQGFKRVRRALVLGDFKSNHSLVMSVAYDYQEYFLHTTVFNTSGIIDAGTWGSQATWGGAAVWGGVQDNVYQFRAHLKRQKCESIKFRFEDQASDGESYSINSLALEVAIKRGGFKMRSAKSLGTS